MSAAKMIKNNAQSTASPVVTVDEEDEDVAVPLGAPPPQPARREPSPSGERAAPVLSPHIRLTGERVSRLVLCAGVTVAVGERETFGTWRSVRGDGTPQDWTCEVAVHEFLGPILVFVQRPNARPSRNDRPQYVPMLSVASLEFEVGQ